MKPLVHRLERSVHVAAPPATVFRYFTDSARFAAWWGGGSSIEPEPGGRVHIVYPNGVQAGGEVVELEQDRRIVLTYGYASGVPMGIGGSRVTITLEPAQGGTRLHLLHELSDSMARDAHVPGWAHQLAVFAGVVAREAHGAAPERLDRFFALWSETDGERLAHGLDEVVAEGFTYRDAHACTAGRGEFAGHLRAVQGMLPGARVERRGEPRLCQGMALVEWSAVAGDGSAVGRGTSAVRFDGEGRLVEVFGFWEGS